MMLSHSDLNMEPTGRGRNLDLPPNAKLLALHLAKAHPDGGVLMTPVRENQLPLLNNRERRRARRFNRALRGNVSRAPRDINLEKYVR